MLKAKKEGVISSSAPSRRGVAKLLRLARTCLGEQHHSVFRFQVRPGDRRPLRKSL
jgi:hypothetical protein